MQVAVYGSLRKGFGNHNILTGSKFIGKTTEKHPFKMFSLNSFPAIVPSEEQNNLTLEVYEINDEILQRLDRLEGYNKSGNSLYDRTEINTKFGKSYVYFMHKTRSNILVESGDWYEFKMKYYEEKV